MIDLNSILSAITGNTAQRQAGLAAQADYQTGVTDQIEQAGLGQIAQTRDLIAEQTQLKQDASALTMQRALVNEQATKLIGLDPADLNNEFAQSIAEMNNAEERRKVARAEYNKYAGATILSDPFTWLAAQVALPELAANVNMAADERDAAIQNLQTRHSLLNTQKSVVTAATARQAHELEAREAALQAKDATLRLSSAESKLSADMAGRRMNEFNLRDKGMQLELEKLDKVLTVDQMFEARANRRLQFQMQQEAAAERRELANERRDNRAEAEAIEAEQNLNLQRASQLLGLPTTLTVKQLKGLPLPKEQKELLARVALTGQLGADTEQVMDAFAMMPDAMMNLRQTNPMFAQTVENAATAIDSYYATLVSRPGPDGKPLKHVQAKELANETFRDETIKSANARGYSKPMNSPAWDNQYNPYKVNHKLMVKLTDDGQAGFLKDNLYVKSLRAVASTVPPDRETFRGQDENAALSAMAAHVRNRDIPPRVAAKQISDYYNAAKFIQADQTQYGVLKLPLPKRYHVSLPPTTAYGSQRIIDLLNPLEVEKALLEEVRAAETGPAKQMLGTVLQAVPGGQFGGFVYDKFIDPAFRGPAFNQQPAEPAQ